MVKIVGRDEAQVHECTCYRCASKLEYTVSEIIFFKSKDITQTVGTYKYITCPSCGSKVYL